MRADAFAVEIDARAIIDRAEAEKLAFAGFGIGSEVALIPDQPPIMAHRRVVRHPRGRQRRGGRPRHVIFVERSGIVAPRGGDVGGVVAVMAEARIAAVEPGHARSEEHKSEIQSLMRISYA